MLPFRVLQEYGKEYSTFKPDKRLHWMPHLGSVELKLVFDGKIIETEVSPIEAAVIGLFHGQDSGIWSTDDMMKRLNVDYAQLFKALTTWIDYDVLEECGKNRYRVVDPLDQPSAPRNTARRKSIALLPRWAFIGFFPENVSQMHQNQ